jgi:prevent-host-death family protein
MTMVNKSSIDTVAAGEFKAKCLRIMDRVSSTRKPVVVTRKGKPLVKLVPADDAPPDVFGCLSEELEILGDIESPVVEETDWNALR